MGSPLGRYGAGQPSEALNAHDVRAPAGYGPRLRDWKTLSQSPIGSRVRREIPGSTSSLRLSDTESMRQLYAHDAVVRMNPTDDPSVIGAAITVALCGDWQHEPPCPLAPHHTRTERREEKVHVRTLFAT